MAITVETMQQVGANLKREAAHQQRPVDDRFLVELYTYAHQPILHDLDEPDIRTVVEAIGRKALEEYKKLDVQAIRATIRRVCNPHNPWDLCHKAARNILSNQGQRDAVDQIDRTFKELLNQLGKE